MMRSQLVIFESQKYQSSVVQNHMLLKLTQVGI